MPKNVVKKLTTSAASAVSEIFESHRSNPQFINYGLNWSIDQTKESLNHLAYGLEVSGRLVSVLFARKLHDSLFEIDMMQTHKDFLKSGYMSELFKYFLTELLKSTEGQSGERPEVWLEVHELNHIAIEFYKKLGFTQTSRRLSYYPDGCAAVLLSLKVRA